MEFDGSPLTALKVVPPFDHLYFADLNRRNVNALRRRIAAEDFARRVTLRQGDCNVLTAEVVSSLSHRTLGLAFVDPEGFEATFPMFHALATRRIDVLLLFPSGIGIRRNLRQFARQEDSPMDRLWGGREWRDLPAAKLAAGRRLSPEEFEGLDKPWVERFRRKMAAIGFEFQDADDPCFKNEKNVPMYHLLFFARHPAGLTIWRNIKRVEPTGQRTLF